MSKMEKTKRYFIFLIGLLVSSLGVAMVTKADLGTSPISSIPYVLSLNFPFSLGVFTVFFSLFLILLQLIILKKEFKLEHVLQIPVSIIFGVFIDGSMAILSFMNPHLYIAKVIYLLVGCLVLGIGVYFEVLANVVMLPGESFVRAIVYRWKTDFGTTKVAFDVSMTIIAAALSFIFSGALLGVREGTVVAAMLVGFIARFIGRKLHFLPEKLFPNNDENIVEEDKVEAKKHVCIAIGRQYGSGGHDIGESIAKELSFDFYDREIIQMSAGSTGYTPEFITKHEEQMSNNLIHDFATQMYAYSAEMKTPEDEIFDAEKKIVLDASKSTNCVIVGRCADALLKDNENVLRVFLSAPLEYRVERIMRTENLSEKEAKKKIHLIDRRRAAYYRYYTNQIWGMSDGHHICIDTSVGSEKVKKMILNSLEDYLS